MLAIKQILRLVLLSLQAPFLRMHQEPETQNHPKHQGGLYPWKLVFGTLSVPHIERSPVQGTVASPTRLPGSVI
jgi:hypothetical protein